ncbi:MAG: metal/formaldehyde-sensitive transcriptional repressor [Burkholderiaceae bacterium]
MAHTARDKTKLLHRIRRIRGQLDAVERALEAEAGCADVLQRLTAARGAMNGLMAIVIEGHLRDHVAAPGKTGDAARAQAADELMQVVRAYLR